MKKSIKILIVEDEMLIAANISLDLTKLGYEVTGIIPRGEEALVHVKENMPDLILLDIQLKGKIDGVETAKILKQQFDIPVIFLTANADEANFARAKETKPDAFISKPFKKLDLQRAIELVETRITEENQNHKEPKNVEVLVDSIFVRDHDKMVKVAIKDIYYIEAERNYCRIFGSEKEHLLVLTLKDLAAKLPSFPFVRIHRSYIVNVSHIDEVTSQNLSIKGETLPISKGYRNELLDRIRLI